MFSDAFKSASLVIHLENSLLQNIDLDWLVSDTILTSLGFNVSSGVIRVKVATMVGCSSVDKASNASAGLPGVELDLKDVGAVIHGGLEKVRFIPAPGQNSWIGLLSTRLGWLLRMHQPDGSSMGWMAPYGELAIHPDVGSKFIITADPNFFKAIIQSQGDKRKVEQAPSAFLSIQTHSNQANTLLIPRFDHNKIRVCRQWSKEDSDEGRQGLSTVSQDEEAAFLVFAVEKSSNDSYISFPLGLFTSIVPNSTQNCRIVEPEMQSMGVKFLKVQVSSGMLVVGAGRHKLGSGDKIVVASSGMAFSGMNDHEITASGVTRYIELNGKSLVSSRWQLLSPATRASLLAATIASFGFLLNKYWSSIEGFLRKIAAATLRLEKRARD